jgi:hypothetical protein
VLQEVTSFDISGGPGTVGEFSLCTVSSVLPIPFLVHFVSPRRESLDSAEASLRGALVLLR